MQLLKSNLLIPFAVLSTLGRVISAPTKTPFCGLKPGSIPNSQPLQGDEFIGAAVSPSPLLPKVEFNPQSSALHADGGNTNTVDYLGPLGNNLNITTLDWQYGQFFWDAYGTMFAAYVGPCGTSATNITQALAVIDSDTLAVEAIWQPPAKYAKT